MSRSHQPSPDHAAASSSKEQATAHHLTQEQLLFVFHYLREDHEMDSSQNYAATPNTYTDRAEILAALGRFFDDPELRPLTVLRTF